MRRNKSTGLAPYSDSVTCVPTAYIDAGMDPASVDFRNFFAYIPNEVKHRKRTTRDQVKVLESIFDRNTKPDSTLRQRLATELQMSARGVQVWFQNRRAKEKSMGKKATANGPSSTAFNLSGSSSPNEESSKATEEHDEGASPSASSTTPSPELSPAHKPSASIPLENSQSAPPEIPNYAATQQTAAGTGPPQASLDLYNTRRGSLPTIIQAQPTLSSRSGPGRSPAGNILARRGSAERLGVNPYARFLMSRASASARVAPYQPRPTSLRESHDQASLHEDATHFDATAALDQFESRPAMVGPDRPRPMLGHRASMPHVLSDAYVQRRASMPMDPVVSHPLTSTSNSVSTSTSTFTMADNHIYAISSRTIHSPIPGPLPRPDFSFGPPADSPLGSSSPAPAENNNNEQLGDSISTTGADYMPSLQNYTFGRRSADDNDTEDDATEASYDALSRFGSISSVAGSESSNTSAYYSDVGSCNDMPPVWYPDTRRGSYASSEFLDLVSELDLGHGRPESDDGDYPTGEVSPSSTVSPGTSHGNSPPCKFANTSTPNLPISGSSELAHALQTNHGQKDRDGSVLPESSTITSLNAGGATAQYMYMQSSAPIYPQSDSNSSSSSSLNLPITPLEQQQKTHQDSGDSGQFDHYHNHNPRTQTHSNAHPSSHTGHYSTTGSYTPHNHYGAQEMLELHHAMEYQNRGYIGSAVDMSAVENTLQTYETYLQYR